MITNLKHYVRISEFEPFFNTHKIVIKHFIVEQENLEQTFDFLKDLNSKANILIKIDTNIDIEFCNKNNIPWMFNLPITNWADLNAVILKGASEVLIDGVLFFCLKDIKTKYPNIKLRVSVNGNISSNLLPKNGIHRTFIRPEDIELYSKYIDTAEFSCIQISEEKALFNIYAIDKNWPGNLNFLIKNLNYNIMNPGIPNDWAENRINCGQRCEELSSCRFCDNCFKLINTIDKMKDDEEWKKQILNS